MQLFAFFSSLLSVVASPRASQICLFTETPHKSLVTFSNNVLTSTTSHLFFKKKHRGLPKTTRSARVMCARTECVKQQLKVTHQMAPILYPTPPPPPLDNYSLDGGEEQESVMAAGRWSLQQSVWVKLSRLAALHVTTQSMIQYTD